MHARNRPRPPFPKPSRKFPPKENPSSLQPNPAKLAIAGPEVAGAEHLPEEIDTEASAELDEEPVHLAEVGGVAVGVEHGGGGRRVAHVDAHDLVAAARA